MPLSDIGVRGNVVKGSGGWGGGWATANSATSWEPASFWRTRIHLRSLEVLWSKLSVLGWKWDETDFKLLDCFQKYVFLGKTKNELLCFFLMCSMFINTVMIAEEWLSWCIWTGKNCKRVKNLILTDVFNIRFLAKRTVRRGSRAGMLLFYICLHPFAECKIT